MLLVQLAEVGEAVGADVGAGVGAGLGACVVSVHS
jgi:hypothetical protein